MYEQQLNVMVLWSLRCRLWVFAAVVASSVITNVGWLLDLGPSFVLLETSVEVLDLRLKIVNLTHIYTLIEQVLPFDLIFIHYIAIRALSWRWVMASLGLLLCRELISLIFLLILLDLNLLLVVLAHDRHGVSVSREALLLRHYLILRCMLLSIKVATVVFNLTLWCSWLMFVISITPLLRVSLSVRFTFLRLYVLCRLLLRACVRYHFHLSLDLT